MRGESRLNKKLIVWLLVAAFLTPTIVVLAERGEKDDFYKIPLVQIKTNGPAIPDKEYEVEVVVTKTEKKGSGLKEIPIKLRCSLGEIVGEDEKSINLDEDNIDSVKFIWKAPNEEGDVNFKASIPGTWQEKGLKLRIEKKKTWII